MKTNDILIACISWPGGGKRHPIYVLNDEDGIISFYKITTKYAKKFTAIKQMYFPIQHWKESGLTRQSYIDTITVGLIDSSAFNLEYIGHLTIADAKDFRLFLDQQDN